MNVFVDLLDEVLHILTRKISSKSGDLGGQEVGSPLPTSYSMGHSPS